MINNEIFYRVALMRERWQARNPNKPKFPTGHFHVAMKGSVKLHFFLIQKILFSVFLRFKCIVLSFISKF
jgi:hypothetical protein